jgi:uncharacterized protein (DUF924 family)
MTERESRFDVSGIVPDDVLHFWFGPPGSPPLHHSKRWYTKDAAFDRQIEEQFGDALELAARGGLDKWKTSPRGRLALVILLDQFSRNVFRNTPRSFAQDARACDATLEAMGTPAEQELDVVERTFLYMPLMHAESVDLQHKCVAAFERLVPIASAELRGYVENGLAYARRHEEIVERFGRFPHRNTILGRSSTPAEVEFLKQPNSSF